MEAFMCSKLPCFGDLFSFGLVLSIRVTLYQEFRELDWRNEAVKCCALASEGASSALQGQLCSHSRSLLQPVSLPKSFSFSVLWATTSPHHHFPSSLSVKGPLQPAAPLSGSRAGHWGRWAQVVPGSRPTVAALRESPRGCWGRAARPRVGPGAIPLIGARRPQVAASAPRWGFSPLLLRGKSPCARVCRRPPHKGTGSGANRSRGERRPRWAARGIPAAPGSPSSSAGKVLLGERGAVLSTRASPGAVPSPARRRSGGARRAEGRSAAEWTGARRGAERRWERDALGDGPQGELTGRRWRLPEPLPGRGPVSSAWRGPPAAEGRAARRLSDCCSGRCCAEVSGERSTSWSRSGCAGSQLLGMAACFPRSGVKPFSFSAPHPRVSSFSLHVLSALSYAFPPLPSTLLFLRSCLYEWERTLRACMTETRSGKFPCFSRCLLTHLRYCLVIKGFSLWEWVFPCGTRWKL